VAALQQEADAVIVIPNDRLLKLAGAKMTMVRAFALADDVLRHGVQGISDLITITGLINLDFADIRSVLSDSGLAHMAIGEAAGNERALRAADAALSSPLLETPTRGARGALVNVTGGPDMTLLEVNEAVGRITEALDPDADIIFGAVVRPRPEDELHLTLIAAGVGPAPQRAEPQARPRVAPAAAPPTGPAPEPRHPSPGEFSRALAPPELPPPPAREAGGAPDADQTELPAFLRRRWRGWHP
jgi:cell division protein FtsZ